MSLPSDFTFAQKVKDVKSLPPEAQSLYVKGDDGEYALDPVMAKHLDVAPLASSLDKERKRAKELEKMVNGFKSIGLGDTPEEVMAALKKAEEDADDGTSAGDDKVEKLQELRAKLKAEFDETLRKTVGEKDEALTKMQRSMHKHLVEKEAIAALAKHKGSTDLLLPHVISKLGLIEQDGEYVVRVLDKDGDPAGDGRGGFKSVDQFVAEMRADEKFSRAFDSTGKSGTGSKPFTSGKGGGSDAPMTSVNKISQGLSQRR